MTHREKGRERRKRHGARSTVLHPTLACTRIFSLAIVAHLHLVKEVFLGIIVHIWNYSSAFIGARAVDGLEVAWKVLDLEKTTNESGEFRIVDLTIAIEIGFSNHVVQFVIGQLLTWKWKHKRWWHRQWKTILPRLLITERSSISVIKPLPSLSKIRKASLSSSSLKMSTCVSPLRLIISLNSLKLIRPSPVRG